MKSIIWYLSIIGLILSIYALYVIKKSKKKSYKPLCDISKNISCTKSFSSKEGKLAVLPNPWYGTLFYSIILILISLNQIKIIFFLSIFIGLITTYLAYISYIKQRNFCVVCTGIYIINFFLLIFSYLQS